VSSYCPLNAKRGGGFWIRPSFVFPLILLSLKWEGELIRERFSFFVYLRELQREKVWSRIHLVPLLMAEGDRDLYRRQQAALKREKEIMKDVPGWEVGDMFFKYHQMGVI